MATLIEQQQWVYSFDRAADLIPKGNLRDLLGGKGAGVVEMTQAGLPVPPGFTITTEACREYFRTGRQLPEGMWDQVLADISNLEQKTGRKLGDPQNPLLVSVRSGAKVSMPGMMETVLNIGFNRKTVAGLATLTDNEGFAWDTYRRLIQMFGKTVMRIDGDLFENKLNEVKRGFGVEQDTDLGAQGMIEVASEFEKIFQDQTGQEFPQDELTQIRLATAAVFDSWQGPNAVAYRKREGIPDDLGTAVNIQMMVFGNRGDDSATGVAFTRNPNTGERKLFGEFLVNAQGEDVVAGTRTPRPIYEMAEVLPEVFTQFQDAVGQLEKHYRNLQDVEFTVEAGKFYLLQTRNGKRSPEAAFKIAIDMVEEGLIDQRTAVRRVTTDQVEKLLAARFDLEAKKKAVDEGKLLTKGLEASPGAAVGQVVFDPDRAKELAKKGVKVILVRPETSQDDVDAIMHAEGVLTAKGGKTSHAAVIARGSGKPAVVGAEDIKINLEKGIMEVKGRVVEEGSTISMDGSTGEVFISEIKTIKRDARENIPLFTVLSWADQFSRLQVWANADNPEAAQIALDHGARGIGLCRTEHMFGADDRLPYIRQVILTKDDPQRKTEYLGALEKLRQFQKEDFKGIFRVMRGLPVVVRLIDPPMHEFLPSHEDLLVEVTKLRQQGENSAELKERESLLNAVDELRESNPMMGLRGIRLGLKYQEIIEMQVKALIEAVCELKQEGIDSRLDIEAPLVGFNNELSRTHEIVKKAAEAVMKEKGTWVDYKFGTMIEVPRAALIAGKLARDADFFSFGTNDLTQFTCALSRDDAEKKFVTGFVEDKIYPHNLFQTLDEEGVGELMIMTVERGRAERGDLEIGLCGEHGGDPTSIRFVDGIEGIDYTSCSPYRVPVARLAAAQAAIERQELQVL